MYMHAYVWCDGMVNYSIYIYCLALLDACMVKLDLCACVCEKCVCVCVCTTDGSYTVLESYS